MTDPTYSSPSFGAVVTEDHLFTGSRLGGVAVLPGNPLLPLLQLSDDEAALVAQLTSLVLDKRFPLEISDAYYRGQQRVTDLGISIPPVMRRVHEAMGWPRVCVDALEERLDIEGFMYPDSSDVDEDLMDIWLANDLDSEQHVAHLDSLVFGQSYVAVGSGVCGPGGDCPPLITVESPLDIGVIWDARSRTVLYALRLYEFENTRQATLYTPDETVNLIAGAPGGGAWEVLGRDRHNLGITPIERIANRPRSYDRDGTSEITTEIMSMTDAGCRTLLGLEVAREFYSAPQRYILGASESAFQDADGHPLDAWQTYLGRVLALERDEEGNVPTVGQFTPYNPEVFTKIIDMLARLVSSVTGLPPHVLGYTTDNPASADAIRSSEMRLKKKADRKARSLGTHWRNVMKLALMIRDRNLPDGANRIATVWADTGTPTPAATTDSIAKQVQTGVIPATSDVTLSRLGYTPAERARLAADTARDEGRQFLAQLATSLTAKEARVDTSLAHDLTTPAAVGTAPGTTQNEPSGGSPGA